MKRKVISFLEEPIDKIVLVVCANLDFFHGKGGYFLRYIIFGKGYIIDEPNEAIVRQVFVNYPSLDKVLIYSPCTYCIDKGVTGPVGYGYPPSYKEE